MFHSRSLNNKINRIHERALRIVYNDTVSSFSDLLVKDNSVSIHQRNLQVLATEMYKIKNNIAPTIVSEIFNTTDLNIPLRLQPDFQRPFVRSVYHGTESLSFLGPSIWNQVPNEIKQSASLSTFKNNIKALEFSNCPCRICKTYIQQIGFI